MSPSRLLGAAGLSVLIAACGSGRPHPSNVDLEADQFLWSMGQALAQADAFTTHGFVTSELGTAGGSVVKHSGEVDVRVRRPDRLSTSRRGERINRDVRYDGEAVHVVDLAQGVYASEPIPEGKRELGAVVDYLVDKYGLVLPLADFLYPNPYDVLIENVELGRALGLRQMGDLPCEHLAFRSPAVDWQIWIEAGSEPLPRKFVIKDTVTESGPEFSAEFDQWDLNPELDEDLFRFTPPADLREVSLATLLGLEEEG